MLQYEANIRHLKVYLQLSEISIIFNNFFLTFNNVFSPVPSTSFDSVPVKISFEGEIIQFGCSLNSLCEFTHS